MKTFYLAGLLAAVTVSTAALAGDTPFTPDAAATWSARSLLMSKVYDDAADGTLTKRSFGVACDGITGEQMKHEYGKVPRWALTSQLEICTGYNGLAGKFGGSKKPCVNLKSALKDLGHASDPGTPPDVTAAAGTLTKTLLTIIEAGGGKNGCEL